MLTKTKTIPIPKKRRRKYNDKIFDNKYNTGSLEYDIINEKMELDRAYIGDKLSPYYDPQTQYHTIELNKIINEIYQGTVWQEEFGVTGRIPKHLLTIIFDYFADRIQEDTYTFSEIFVAVAEYLDVHLKTLYEMAAPIYKRRLLEELDEKYQVIKNSNITPLF